MWGGSCAQRAGRPSVAAWGGGGAPSLEGLRAVVGALGGCWGARAAQGGGRSWMTPKVPSSPSIPWFCLIAGHL